MANVGVGVNDPAHVHDGEPVNQGRRRFLTATTAVVGAVGAGFAAVPFIKSWNPSARAKLAGAPVTADISALAEGHAHGARVARPADLDRQALQGDARRAADARPPPARSQVREPGPAAGRTPATNCARSSREISVLVGLCTHLGCSPEMKAEIKPEPFDPEWKGGYFCPCHKSRFDMAGRVFQGVPAPTNLRRAAAPLRERHDDRHRRRPQGGSVSHGQHPDRAPPTA